MRIRRCLTIFCVGAVLFFFLLPVIGRSGPPPHTSRHWNPNTTVGTYKLVSLVVEIDGTRREVMGKAAHGYLMITPTHFMTFFTSGDRQFGTSVDEKAALFDTLVGFAGTYRIEGHAFVRTDDVSWTENMNGKTVVQMYHISGNLLTLTHGPIPWPVDPSKTWTCRQVWEKIE